MTYDKLVEIQTQQHERDRLGTSAVTWKKAGDRWAHIQDQGGGELYRAQKADSTVQAVITLRQRMTGLTAQDRVVWSGRTFSIKAVISGDDRTARRGQVLHCTEVTADTDGNQ